MRCCRKRAPKPAKTRPFPAPLRGAGERWQRYGAPPVKPPGLAAGCDYSEDDKNNVPETVLRLLTEMSAPRANRPETVRDAALPGGTAPA
jgi:hypothetical protein